jgi:hypothetical protein
MSHHLLSPNLSDVCAVELLGRGVTTGDMLASARLQPGLVFQTAVSAPGLYSMYS